MSGPAHGRWIRVCRTAELEPDTPRGFVVEDGPTWHPVCVIAHAGRVVAAHDRCPHRDIALSDGIVRHGELVCPGHFWRFDLTTGQRTDDPATALTRYGVRLVDEWVEVELPAARPFLSMRHRLLAAAADRDVHPGPPWP